MRTFLKTAGGGLAPRGLGAWAGGVLASMALTEQRHRDRVRLAALPDHLLADIGLTRDAVRGPHGRREGC